jgi:type I restriction enzyme S subunit
MHGMIGGITREDVNNFLIPVPPIEEQQKIVEIISTIDEKLNNEKMKKEKLLRLKKGLLNDLLSGKKRVK